MQGIGLLTLRFVVGTGFAIHGAATLLSLGRSPEELAAELATAGIEPAYAVAVSIAVINLAGGLLLVAGAYTTSVAIALGAPTLCLALLLRAPNGFFLDGFAAFGAGHGYEYDLLRLGALCCLALAGPGPASIDRRRARLAATVKLSNARLRAGKL